MQKRNSSVFLIFFILAFSLWFGCLGCSGPGTVDNGADANSDQTFSFIFMGDTQADLKTGDYTAWGKLLKAAAGDESQPSFLLLAGDLINDSSDQKEWENFLAAGEEIFTKIRVYPALGNHDNLELYKTSFDLPQNGPVGQLGAFYSFDYGDAHFTVLDSNAMGAAIQSDLVWLKNDLAETNKTYKIVMFHHPAYPAAAIPKDTLRAETIQENFVPVFEQAGVDLVLCGHQHVYMRTYPLRNGQRDEAGIIYLVGNSGGKQYTPALYDYAADIIGDKAVYSIITVAENGIFIETKDADGTILDSTKGPAIPEAQKTLGVTVKGDGITSELRLTLGELAALPNSGFEHIYSTVNNWPTSRFYAAKGITVRSILKTAGVLDTAQVITFRSADSYSVSFTREQLLERPHYYYPHVKEGSAEKAELVEPILAYAFKEGSSDLSAALADDLTLIIGQRNPAEHTNPAFVVNVSEIVVSNEEPTAWKPASTFPKEGKIAAKETVKLQHPDLGLVKLHYTLDGTEPTELSPIYNPSTYQPELNVPIPITKDMVIKVLAAGYGRKNSPVATFTFKVQ